MSHKRILIVEDEAEIADLIRFHVEREGFEARIAENGPAALDAVRLQAPDVISLDILLPGLGGLEVCRALKVDAKTAKIPIVIVSALGEEADVVAGLELGADDYVTKPFRPRVLMARLKAVMRRGEDVAAGSQEASHQLVLGDGLVVLDPELHEVRVGGDRIELTITEFRLLEHLAGAPGFVRTRHQIVSAIRGEGTVLSSRAVDVHVASLRRKLREGGAVVETVRGVGYRVSTDHVPGA